MSNLVTVRVTIRDFEAPEREWAAIGDEIFATAVQLAEQTSLIGATAAVELVDGSLKAKAALVGGLLLATYTGIAAYKDFKDSLAEIAQDSRKVATAIEAAIPRIVGRTRDIARQDVKKGKAVIAAEEISKLIEQLEDLKENSKTMSEAELEAKINGIGRRFRSLRTELDHKDMTIVERYMVSGGLPIPRRLPPLPVANQSSREAVRPDTFEELRRQIEEAELQRRRPKGAADFARSAGPRRPRRRMYYRSAPVRPAAGASQIL